MYFYILILSLIVVLIVISFELVKHSRFKADQLKAVRAFQESNDLNNRDLKIFKETMKEAKAQILLAEKSVGADKKKGASIDAAIEASKEIFKYLMDEPKSIVLYSDFLYRSLPAFSSALERKQLIQKTQIENEEIGQTKEALDDIIIELSETIIAEYSKYIKEELEETTIDNIVVKQGERKGTNEKEKR